MAAGEAYVPDWRDAAAYAPLLHADRSLLAWEWLRRNPDYRTAAERGFEAVADGDSAGTHEPPERWGLQAFEWPGAAVPGGRPIWRTEVHPYVLGVEAEAALGDDIFELERFAAISSLMTAADGREHLLISDGFRSIRIDVLSGTLGRGPARLHYRLGGLASAERPVLTLRRFLTLCRTGSFSCSLHSGEARAKRWLLMLRAHDGRAAGADQREIAAVLLSAEAGEPRWRTGNPSVRSQVQRLVRGARRMASGGYLGLLQ